MKNFRSELSWIRPDAAGEIYKDKQRRKIALALRSLRKERGMTQKDIEKNSTLSQPVISRLEVPTGPFPTWDTIIRYIQACDAHMLLSFSTHEFDEASFRDSQSSSSKPIIALTI